MDTRLFEAINGIAGRQDVVGDLFEMIAHDGPFLMIGTLLGLWFWPASRARRDQLQTSAIVATLSATLALGVNQEIIHLWDRPRPFVAHATTLLLSPSKDPSFPSDHATFAFAVAVAVLLVARRAGWVLSIFAALLGLARVWTGEHYPSDVFVGAAIGSLVAVICTAEYPRIERILDPALRSARRYHLA